MVFPTISMDEMVDFVLRVKVFTSKPLPFKLNFPEINPTELFLVIAAALRFFTSKTPTYFGSCKSISDKTMSAFALPILVIASPLAITLLGVTSTAPMYLILPKGSAKFFIL